MALCAVKWCAALAIDGPHCPVHAKHPDLRPAYLADDEEMVDGGTADCCKCDGTGECQTCDGDGEHSHYCSKCESDQSHDCGVCDGDGQCRACRGEGTVTHRKKVDAA